ncbi:hypothetical protein ACFWNK_05405 [Streptomyces sp. NPDC058417]|uniref:hypothetical protein n=1 Tax=unclassified Streptomyces TaxID=2593676 RepID=UPI003662D173
MTADGEGEGRGGRTAAEWWELLPAGVRGQVDRLVLQDAWLPAVRALWEAGRARGLGLTEAQYVVHERLLHHGDRVARTPPDPLDAESLDARAAGAPGRVVAVEAVEAVWDGDTVHDWFVNLIALTEAPEGEMRPATVYRSAATACLGDEDSGARHPSAVVAARVGGAPAGRLSVPFHFGSPDDPDDEAPRLRR